MRSKGNIPYKSLGVQLKELRQKLQESVADVAGAVEIDEEKMALIEQGAERPTEDILILLINHYGIQEDEAVNLWVLAGYDEPHSQDLEQVLDQTNQSTVIMMALDTRILYIDQTQVTADKNGVVMNFMQNAPAPANSPKKLPVSRIGMSYEQAKSLLNVLQRTLLQADQMRRPKGLPAPKDNSPKPPKTDTN